MPSADRRPRPDRRIGLLALAAIVSLVTLVVAPAVLRDEAMAVSRWTPFVVSSIPPVAPPPAAGSDEERRQLDELLAIQAARTSDEVAAAVPWLGAGVVGRWNDVLLGLIREDKTNPVRASRNLALLNVAIHDAVIAACRAQVATPSAAPHERDGRISPLVPVAARASYPSAEAAVATAAEAVLSYLYPGRTREFERLALEARHAPLLTGTSMPAGVEAGTAMGRAVGAAVVARGQADGSTAVWRGTLPTGEGVWKPAPTAVGGPIEPMAGTWRTWILSSGWELRAPPPPIPGSPDWQREADEVVRITANLTDDQVRIARSWADGSGTETPPGHWARIALGLIARDRLSLAQSARTMAHLAVAQADGFIACWETKFHYWTGRPTGLIKGFASTILTPNFPSYTSGHSTQSGAAAVVLGHFFPHDAGRLEAMAEEAAVSRLYGGIHYRSDNEAGLRIGREIGRRTVERAISGSSR